MTKLKQAIRFSKMNSRITPRLAPWLVSNGEVRITSVKVHDKVVSILRPEVVKSRAGAFHPSQLYSCERAQVYAYHDAPAAKQYDPTLQNLFNDGHFRHLRWQIMLMEAGILTDIEVPASVPELRLSGSIDGVNSDERWLFELKGTSQFRTIQSRGVMPAHIQQIHAYLLAAKYDEAIVVYECKSTQQWAELVVKRDPTITAEILNILEELNRAIEEETLPERLPECEVKSGPAFASCPYASICHGCNHPDDIATLRQTA
jgi:hypothetical protein